MEQMLVSAEEEVSAVEEAGIDAKQRAAEALQLHEESEQESNNAATQVQFAEVAKEAEKKRTNKELRIAYVEHNYV